MKGPKRSSQETSRAPGEREPRSGERGPWKRISSPTAPAPGGQRRPGLSLASASAGTEDQEEHPVLIRGGARLEERGSVPAGGLKAAERNGGGAQWMGGPPVTYLHQESVEDRAWPTYIQGGRAGGSAAWPCPWGACHPCSQGTRTQERTSLPLPSSLLGALHKQARNLEPPD